MVQIKLNTKSGKWEKIKNFISHMVQIKTVIITKSITKKLSLYPTWFRLNQACQNYSIRANYFISHMVQIKHIF